MKTKGSGKWKKAFAAILCSCVLMVSVAPQASAKKWWQDVLKFIGIDTGNPCWSAYADDGSHHFMRCGGSCPYIAGLCEGPEGTCPN